METAAILDVEANGRFPNEVIQLAYQLLDGPDREIKSFLFEPVQGSTCGAIAVHKIPSSRLKGCPPSGDAPKYVPKVGYIIGHGIDYDWEALGKPDVGRICTLALSRELFPDKEGHKLGAMMFRIMDEASAIELIQGAHDAEVDVVMTKKLWEYIWARYGCRSYADMWERSEIARIPKVMTFGKHRDEPIESVPIEYIKWLVREQEKSEGKEDGFKVDPYLMKALTRRLGPVQRKLW